MNIIHKIIWNRTTQRWGTIKELAKGRSKVKSIHSASYNLKSHFTPKIQLLSLIIALFLISEDRLILAAPVKVDHLASFTSSLQSGDYDTFILGSVIQIDEQGKHGLIQTANSFTSGLRLNGQTENLTFKNMTARNTIIYESSADNINRVKFNNLTGLAFAVNDSERNEININGTGTGIIIPNTDINNWDPGALTVNVSGVGKGIGIHIIGGGGNLNNIDLVVNVTNPNGVGIFSLGSTDNNITTNTMTIGKSVIINASNATALLLSGNHPKQLINNGTINGKIEFTGGTSNIITNNYIINGSIISGVGNDTLTLKANSQSNGNINLGDGVNRVTIENTASVANVTTGSGNDKFTLSGLTLGSTYLGVLDAGTGINTLNFNTSIQKLDLASQIKNFGDFGQINLNNSQLALVSANNILNSNLYIGNNSQLIFDGKFNGYLDANISSIELNEGKIITQDQSNITLTKPSGFSGEWQIDLGSTVTSNISSQLGSGNIALSGILNLNNQTSSTNILTGNGLLNVNANNQNFNFSPSVGSQFKGVVSLTNSKFNLGNDNTLALTQANLEMASGSLTTVVDGAQTIGQLTFSGGELLFNNITESGGKFTSQGKILANKIDTSDSGTVKVKLPSTVSPDLSGYTLMQLDDGAIIVDLAKTSSVNAVVGTGRNLTLTDETGVQIPNNKIQDILNFGSLGDGNW